MKMNKQSILLTLGIVSLVGCGSSSDPAADPRSDEGSDKSVNQAPIVESVEVTNLKAGQPVFSGMQLMAGYRYSDAEKDVEGATKIEWLLDGESTAEGDRYTVPRSAANRDITIRVTPIAQTGALEGSPVSSEVIPVGKRQFVPFAAQTNDPMREMYVTDGTEEGTYAVADFLEGGYKENSRAAFSMVINGSCR